MRPRRLALAALLPWGLIAVVLVVAMRVNHQVPVSPKLPITFYLGPLGERMTAVQTFDQHTRVSRVDLEIRAAKPTAGVLEVRSGADHRTLRSASARVEPGVRTYSFEFPTVAASVEGPVWRPLEFAISCPEQTPGTEAGVAVDLNDPYRDGELYGEGVDVVERGNLRFRA
jgi:hypothetical protein